MPGIGASEWRLHAKGAPSVVLFKNSLLIAGGLVLLVATTACFAQTANGKALTEVYHNDDFQVTGISVSKTGRLFVNFPRWSDHYLNAVVEVMPDGSMKPFPDEQFKP